LFTSNGIDILVDTTWMEYKIEVKSAKKYIRNIIKDKNGNTKVGKRSGRFQIGEKDLKCDIFAFVIFEVEDNLKINHDKDPELLFVSKSEIKEYIDNCNSKNHDNIKLNVNKVRKLIPYNFDKLNEMERYNE